jgi:arsenate reductase
MAEVGLDLSGQRPAFLSDALAHQAQVLVTMGCGDRCPVVPGAVREDWPLPDPKGRALDDVRALREVIRVRVVELIAHHGWQVEG